MRDFKKLITEKERRIKEIIDEMDEFLEVTGRYPIKIYLGFSFGFPYSSSIKGVPIEYTDKLRNNFFLIR